MAEACIVSHAESRRCLPAWMLKACSSNEVAKTDRNVQALEFDKQPGALDQIKPVKRKSGRRLKSVDAEDAGELGVLQRCQGREKVRRKSKDADHAVTDELEEIEKVTSKNVRKASRRAAPKNSRKRKLENVGSGASPSETTDDEIELTVEDLVSIAEEFVNADKEKQQQLQAMKTARYEEHPPCPPISTAVDTGGSVLNARPMKGLLQCTTNTISTAAGTGGSVSNAQPMKGLLQCTTNTTPSECRVDKNNRHEELQCSSSIKMTGDVAQDMLNIFLGPLLSKPAVYERKPEVIESIAMNVNHAPQKKDLHSEVQRQGGPVTKKKSSLKDKVALFL